MGPDEGCSLHDLTRYWQRHSPPPPDEAGGSGRPYPLHHDTMLPRNNDWNDSEAVPWQKLLAEPRGSLVPNLATSEQRFRSRISPQNLHIQRYWDVDSVIAHVTSLAVHKKGFHLSYQPRFSQRVTQNARIRIAGLEPHRMKQLRLGYGVAEGGYRYSTQVLFPHMPVWKGKTTDLHDDARRVWIDDIILPALRIACESNILQHHPHSFRDARNKARAKDEVLIRQDGGVRDSPDFIPGDNLRSFWSAVLARAESFPTFRTPVLMLSAHGLKLTSQCTDAQAMRRDFLQHLDDCFDMSPALMPPQSTWLDLGNEDVPSGASPEGVTLLRKTSCLQEWTKRFACPQSRQTKVTESMYPCLGLRDAASASVELTTSNALRKKGGIAYNKAYNTQKELFATILKGHTPFDNPAFEALGFTQSQLDQWYATNRHGVAAFADDGADSRPSPSRPRDRIVKKYVTAKTRVANALEDAALTPVHFGVRQEYRITLELFRALDLAHETSRHPLWIPVSSSDRSVPESDAPATPSPAGTAHPPYWILPTAEVTAFISGCLNRWVLCLEALAALSCRGPEGLAVASNHAQAQHGVMISAMLRTTMMIFGGTDPKMVPELWRTSWTRRKRRPPQETEGSDADKGHEPTSCLGLGFRDSIQKHGTIWLDASMIMWESLPCFKPELLPRLPLTRSSLQQNMHVDRDISATMERQDQIRTLFRARVKAAAEAGGTSGDLWLEPRFDQVCAAGSQMIIQQYIQEVFAILHKRVMLDVIPQDRVAVSRKWKARLPPVIYEGRRGLCHVVVRVLLGEEPRIIKARPPRHDTAASGRQAYFGAYHETLRWKDRLRALFHWNDHDGKPRGWENAGFRQLTRALHAIIVQETGDEGGRLFLDTLADQATRLLWIIPQYDYDRLSVMQKASKHHSRQTQAHVLGQNALQRTNWLVPVLDPEDHDDLAACDHGTASPEVQARLTEWPDWCVLSDHSPGSIRRGVPRSFASLHFHPSSAELEEFEATLGGRDYR